MTSSTLVETVSIDYEDFSESFLTCGTCLCTYDGQEHTPKLLPCSHTVCRSCLERIAAGNGVRDAGSFRCPICRETIPLPRGGVNALPPSFLVNQLLDLMSRQRREVGIWFEIIFFQIAGREHSVLNGLTQKASQFFFIQFINVSVELWMLHIVLIPYVLKPFVLGLTCIFLQPNSTSSV